MDKHFALGIRSFSTGIRSRSGIRYAILCRNGVGHLEFCNATSENRLIYPASLPSTSAKLKWLKDEMDRIFRQNDAIKIMVIKTNEFVGSETKSKRENTYADAMCILSAEEHGVEVCCKSYTQLLSSSANTRADAEQRVGRTQTLWDKMMADAVLAAYSGLLSLH